MKNQPLLFPLPAPRTQDKHAPVTIYLPVRLVARGKEIAKARYQDSFSGMLETWLRHEVSRRVKDRAPAKK